MLGMLVQSCHLMLPNLNQTVETVNIVPCSEMITHKHFVDRHGPVDVVGLYAGVQLSPFRIYLKSDRV